MDCNNIIAVILLWHDYIIYSYMLPVYDTVIPVKYFTDQPTPQKFRIGLFINNVSNLSVDKKTMRTPRHITFSIQNLLPVCIQ